VFLSVVQKREKSYKTYGKMVTVGAEATLSLFNTSQPSAGGAAEFSEPDVSMMQRRCVPLLLQDVAR
jgi:hypothetical protein